MGEEERKKTKMEVFLLVPLLVFSVLLVPWALRLLYSFWWKPKKLERLLKQQGIFGPPHKFPYGNLKEIRQALREAGSKPMNLSHQILPRVEPYVLPLVNKYGKILVSWLGQYPRLTIVDPSLLKEVFMNRDEHLKKVKLNPYVRYVQPGVTSYDGEEFVFHRRIINAAFSLEKIKTMQPAFRDSCSGLIDRWRSLICGRSSTEVDVWTEFQYFTGDVISRTAFGSNFEVGMKIYKLQNEQASLFIKSARTLYIPGFTWYLPTRDNKRRKELCKEAEFLIRGLIEKREKAMKRGEDIKDDLLGLLIESNLKASQEGGKFKGLTVEEVIDECKLFYFAGQETTSVLLTWTLVTLSMHPTWQTLAREEVLQVFGKNIPNYDGLTHLKTMSMILYEVLRLYPPGTYCLRRTYRPMKLGNFCIPPGVVISVPILLIHHDKDLWGNDADEFKPERFADGISNASKHQGGYFPFGMGPRICPGQNFALVEAKMALTMILQHFSFELSPSYAHAPHVVTLLNPQHGAQVILHEL